MNDHLIHQIRRRARGIPLMLLFVITCCATTLAQTPIKVTVNITPPFSPDLSVWKRNPGRVLVTLVNLDQSNSYTVRLSGHAENVDGGVSLTTKDDYPVTPITLPPGATKRLNGNDLKIFDQNAVTITGADRNVIARTNMLPEGSYRVCVRALDYRSLAALSDGEPVGCASFSIRYAEEPKTLLPLCDDKLPKKTPQLVSFQWSVPVGAPAGTRYDFQLIELSPGTRDPEQAFLSASSFLANKKGLITTSTQYGATEPVLLEGHRYAWRVRAYDPLGNVPFRNKGFSAACAFTVVASGPGIAEDKDTTGPTKSGKGSSSASALPPIASAGDDDGSGDTTADDGPPACTGDCVATLNNTTPAAVTINVGDSVQIGRFSMRITKVTGTGPGGLIGEGMVKVAYLKAPVHVWFNDLKFNAQKQVVSGEATAKQSTLSPFAPEETQGIKAVALALAANKIDELVSRSQQNLFSALTGLDTLQLPFGLDQDIAGGDYVIGVYGMHFGAKSATVDALMSVHLPGFLSPDSSLTLGATGLCIHPGGFGGKNGDGIAQLKLLSDVGYNSQTSVGFLVKAGVQNDSTHVSFTCHGFKELNLVAEASFPRDWFTPLPDNGQRARAIMRANIKKGGSWMANVDSVMWSIVPLKGFSISIPNMVYDRSDSINPAGIIFPGGYKGTTTNQWKGFHMKKATIVMPDFMKTFGAGSPKLAITDAIIDNQGFTADISATNIVQFPKLNLAEWGASLDSVGIRIVANSLSGAKMKGLIRVPISDQGLQYTGVLSVPDSSGSMQYQFQVKPKADLKADLWLADMQIDSSSAITIGNMNPMKTFQASAVLNGSFTLPPTVASITKFALDMQGLKFDSLFVCSSAPYFSPGNWKFASPQKWMAGMPISISNVGLGVESNGGIRAGLKFTIGVNLFDSMLTGKSALSVWAKLGQKDGAQKWMYDQVRVDTIALAADLGAVSFDGLVAFYYNDATYGDGFLGAINVNIAKVLQASATAQFGSINKMRYWYADAKVILPTAIPIPGVGVVGFYGFGGGIWHHMKAPSVFPQVSAAGAAPAANGSVPGKSNSGVAYTPDPSVEVGFKATAVLGTTPSPKTFNGDITLSAEIVRTNGSLGLGSLGLDGKAFIMSDVVNRPNDPPITIAVGIKYDHTQKVLDGSLQYDFTTPIIKSNGTMKMHFAGADDWYVHVGTPQERINITTPFLNSNAYFMTGTYMPTSRIADVLPPGYASEFAKLGPAFNPNKEFGKIEGAGTPGGGIAFGAATSMGTGGPKKILIFYADILAVAGFDIALRHLPDVECEGQNGIGLNQWYAMGQAYAFLKGDVGIEVDLSVISGRFSIFDILAGAMLEAALPNPTFVRGNLAAQYSILGGLVEGSFDFDFELGTVCRLVQENPLASIDLISDVKPKKDEKNVPVFTEPQATFALRPNKEFTLKELEGSEQERTRTYKIVVETARIELPNGDTVKATVHYSNDGFQIGVLPDQPLPGNTLCKFHLRVKGLEKKNGVWVAAETKSKKVIVIDTLISFTTDPKPKFLPTQVVSYSYPRNRQRYFLQKQPDYRNKKSTPFYIQLWQDWGELFQGNAATKTVFKSRYIPVNGGDTVHGPFSYEPKLLKLGQPTLANNTVYRLEIVRVDSLATLAIGGGSGSFSTKTQKDKNVYGDSSIVTIRTARVMMNQANVRGASAIKEKVLYTLYFRTSKFNTLNEKLAGVKAVGAEANTFGNVTALTPEFETDEQWDVYDMKETGYKVGASDKKLPPLVMLDSRQDAPWHQKFAMPAIYGAAAWMKSQGIWSGKKLLREKESGAGIGGPVKAPLKDSEVKPTAGNIPLPDGVGKVIGYNDGTGYQQMNTSKPTFTVYFRDGVHGPFDFMDVQQALEAAYVQNEVAKANNDKYRRLPYKSPQKEKMDLMDTLAPAVEKKLKELRQLDYKKILVGTYGVFFNPYANNTTPPVEEFIYFPGSFKVKPPEESQADKDNAADVVYKAYTGKP